jgi:hypothetical protein
MRRGCAWFRQCEHKALDHVGGVPVCGVHYKLAKTNGRLDVVDHDKTSPYRFTGVELRTITTAIDPELRAEKQQKRAAAARMRAMSDPSAQFAKYRAIARFLQDRFAAGDDETAALFRAHPHDVDAAIRALEDRTPQLVDSANIP